MTSFKDVDSCIGLSGPEFHFPIELGKVREFARALCADHPAYLEGRHPVVPPTFPVVAGYLWGYMLEDPGDTPIAALEMDRAMSLDGEQEFLYHGPPPRAGDDLVARTWVDAIWEKSGRRGGTLTFYRMRSDYHDRDGRLVGTNYATSVVPEGVPDSPAPDIDDSDLPYLAMGERRDQFAAVRQAGWADLVEGEGPGVVTMPPLTLTDVVRYQVISGSYGAGHHDAVAARAEGFPTWFSVGMLHAGLLGTYAVNWLGPANVRRFKARFMDMIWPGERLHYSGSVERRYEEGGERRVDIALSCTRDAGDVVTKGWASFVVP